MNFNDEDIKDQKMDKMNFKNEDDDEDKYNKRVLCNVDSYQSLGFLLPKKMNIEKSAKL